MWTLLIDSCEIANVSTEGIFSYNRRSAFEFCNNTNLENCIGAKEFLDYSYEKDLKSSRGLNRVLKLFVDSGGGKIDDIAEYIATGGQTNVSGNKVFR